MPQLPSSAQYIWTPRQFMLSGAHVLQLAPQALPAHGELMPPPLALMPPVPTPAPELPPEPTILPPLPPTPLPKVVVPLQAATSAEMPVKVSHAPIFIVSSCSVIPGTSRTDQQLFVH